MINKEESERLARIARGRAKARERNRNNHIPDMELGDRHEPAEYFAQVGFFAVLAQIGASEPQNDWSEDGGTEADHQEYVAARLLDHTRVTAWLRAAEVRPIHPTRNGAYIGQMKIAWPDRIPMLKVWSGRQTLENIMKKYQKAIPEDIHVGDVMACTAALTGSSGLYRPGATTSLEDGFSIDELGMKRDTLIVMELLAIIGLETLPITVWPDERLTYATQDGYDRSFWDFRIEPRNDYYSRFSQAERVTDSDRAS